MAECRHALREPDCDDCKGYDRERIAALRLDLVGPCRHALKEAGCRDCKGAPWNASVLFSARQQAISAASDEEKEAIKRWRQEWRTLESVICHWCKRLFVPHECHADHVIPLSLGGLHALSNLVIACSACNLRKNARLPEVWAEMIAAT